MGKFDNKTTTKQINRAQNIENLHNSQCKIHTYIYGLLAVNGVPIIWEEYLCLYIHSEENNAVISFHKRALILKEKQNKIYSMMRTWRIFFIW